MDGIYGKGEIEEMAKRRINYWQMGQLDITTTLQLYDCSIYISTWFVAIRESY